ncbi:hypothetical protein STENM36S_05543 [Streptomyces tendae]
MPARAQLKADTGLGRGGCQPGDGLGGRLALVAGLAHAAPRPGAGCLRVDRTPSHSEAIAGLLPDAELVLVPDAGHLVMLEHPELVTDRLADLLARAGAVPAATTVDGYGSTSSSAGPG